jgi:hypothetical protein
VKFRLLIVALASLAVLSGCGNSSDPVEPNYEPSAPGVPTGLRVENNEFDGSRYLIWNPVSAGDLAGYQVYFYDPDPARENSYEMVAELPNLDTRFQLPALEPGATLTVRVRSFNEGEKPSALSAPLTVAYEEFRHGDYDDVPGGTGKDLP